MMATEQIVNVAEYVAVPPVVGGILLTGDDAAMDQFPESITVNGHLYVLERAFARAYRSDLL